MTVCCSRSGAAPREQRKRGYRANLAFDGGKTIPGGALVIVEDGVITAVEPGSAWAPDGWDVTYMPGSTMLPGLIDTHSHLCGNSAPDALDRLPGLSPDELDDAIEAALTAVVEEAHRLGLAVSAHAQGGVRGRDTRGLPDVAAGMPERARRASPRRPGPARGGAHRRDISHSCRSAASAACCSGSIVPVVLSAPNTALRQPHEQTA